MKPEIQNCLTWLANNVAESCLHRVNPVNLDKDSPGSSLMKQSREILTGKTSPLRKQRN